MRSPSRSATTGRTSTGGQADRVRQLDRETESRGRDRLPAARALSGHMGVRVESEGERALLIADAAVHPMLLDALAASTSPTSIRGRRRPREARCSRPWSARTCCSVCGHYPRRRHRPRRRARGQGRLGGGVTAFREAFPILIVDEVEQASDFYCSVFGFEETYRNTDEQGGVEFAFLALEPYGIGIGRRARRVKSVTSRFGSTPTTSTTRPAGFARRVRRRCCRRPTSRGASACARSWIRTGTSCTSARRRRNEQPQPRPEPARGRRRAVGARGLPRARPSRPAPPGDDRSRV